MKITNMYPANQKKLASSAPELLSLLNDAKYAIADMALLIPEGKGDQEYYEELLQKKS